MTLRNRRSAYGALMDAVVVTPELEQRLLEAVTRRANRRPAVPAWRWLRLAASAPASRQAARPSRSARMRIG